MDFEAAIESRAKSIERHFEGDAEARRRWCDRERAYYTLVEQIKAALVEKSANRDLWERVKKSVDESIIDQPICF